MECLALERRGVLSMHEYLLFKTNARDIDHTSDVPSIHEIRILFPIQASGPHDIRVIGRIEYPSDYRLVTGVGIEGFAACLER